VPVSTYAFEHSWELEGERLTLIETVFDDGTRHHLTRLAVPAGGRCLEVGAGAGSIARWLCGRVGPAGRVVATDLETGFLEGLSEENLEVRRHDIVTDELETDAFDLIHARMVLEHIPERDRVVGRLVGALRPGGWLVLEDFDWGMAGAAPGCSGGELFDRVQEAALRLLDAAGYSDRYGRVLPVALSAAGLVEVGAEGRVHVGVPGSPVSAFWRISVTKFVPALADRKVLSADEIEELAASFGAEDFFFQLPTLVTAWGRRPG
jgi:SAM-dependent methyltransferase